ncbi:hypothetical protein [Mycobacterium kyogaense]|uniref:hypothetical protein n=1 Tax=Mycobacterium kyogaense TaxID=2212479 RepID=UPI0013C4F747|nr:hypothetical protein [Mycobacterium kyogaense]
MRYVSEDDQRLFISEIPNLPPNSFDLDAKFEPYLVAGTDRVYLARMIFAFVKARNESIAYRPIAKRDFFEYLNSSDELQSVWPTLDRDFQVAWDRATEIELLTKVERDSGDELGYVMAIE